VLQLIAILSPIASNKRATMEEAAVKVYGSLASGSVIVYVWRQRDAEVVAENIQASGVSGGVVVYHGGMDATARARSQSRVSTTVKKCKTLFRGRSSLS
jgi:superfamily II DNA helicase RecQ